MKLMMILLTAGFLLGWGCADRSGLPDDPRLERYIKGMAECVYAERSYGHDSEVLRMEIEALETPPLGGLLDSLIADYGNDPEFWMAVYEEIMERSRR
jgi:hypothetical protein